MSTRLFIAAYQSIYHPSDVDRFHWALVVLRPGRSLQERIRVYQITSKRGGPWTLGHADVTLMNTRRFYGCVGIGTTTANMQQLEDALEVADPNQGDTPLLPTHEREGRGWTCAQWIIRFLAQNLVNHRLFIMTPADHDAFYRRAVAIMTQMRLHPDDEYLIVDGRKVDFDSVNGVPTVDIFD